MGDAEKKEIERRLQDGMDSLHDALRGVDEPTAQLRPQPECWSVLECLEHITLAETGLLACLKQATPSPASHEDRAREARFQELALNRARRIEAPDLAIPARNGHTLADAIDALQSARTQTLLWVEEFHGDLRSWLTLHPLITRPVNCYEMLLLIALHPRRHAQQIVEIREQLSRPRSQMK